MYGQAIAGNITSMDDPYNAGLVPAIGGESNGWIDVEFNVPQWASQELKFSIEYITDGGLAMEGFYLDNHLVYKFRQRWLYCWYRVDTSKRKV